jgi:hypothetical protein
MMGVCVGVWVWVWGLIAVDKGSALVYYILLYPRWPWYAWQVNHIPTASHAPF